MNKIFITVLLNCFALFSFAQNDLDPVKLNVEKGLDSSKTEILLVFEIDSNWIVYDSITGIDGPIPLSIKANVNGLLVKPQLKKKFDDLFGMDIYYIEKEVVYKFIPENKLEKTTLIFEVEYMSCNLVSGVCLPPSTQLFTIPLK